MQLIGTLFRSWYGAALDHHVETDDKARTGFSRVFMAFQIWNLMTGSTSTG